MELTSAGELGRPNLLHDVNCVHKGTFDRSRKRPRDSVINCLTAQGSSVTSVIGYLTMLISLTIFLDDSSCTSTIDVYVVTVVRLFLFGTVCGSTELHRLL